MESKFYIGQKVVANRNHSRGMFNKNNIYLVYDIIKTCCGFCIRITNDTYLINMHCADCGKISIEEGSYYSEECFDPIQELEISNMTFEEAIELVTQKKLV